MKTGSQAITVDSGQPAAPTLVLPRVWSGSDFFELTKPRVTLMVVLTTLVGYLMGSGSPIDWRAMLYALGGTALVAASAAALNQFLERRWDAQMRRTENRPLASGRLHPLSALAFALALLAAGLATLLVKVNLLTAGLALATCLSYLLLYTPLKRLTPLCTAIGAVPGAIPPVMGWTAAGQPLDAAAGALFAILFLWQFPHFLAIAWMYREDYARAGFKMLPVIDPLGRSMGRQVVLFNAVLIPVSIMTTWLGLTGMLFAAAALGLGLFYLVAGLRLARQPNAVSARRLLLASVMYLPVLLVVMVLDKQ
ncbi:MAG: heme o synthase [Acidobacteriota bacterium]